MRPDKIIRGLEFQLVLYDKFVIHFLQKKNSVAIADLGAGTNEEIGLSVLDPTPSYLDGIHVSVYLIDQNPSWLSILHQRLEKDIPELVLVKANLEQMTTKAELHNPEDQEFQWTPTSITKSLQTQHQIPKAVMDLVIFNRDMLGWLRFFNSNIDNVLIETKKIKKHEGLLSITQPGLKYNQSHITLEDYGFTFMKHCIIELETGIYSEITTFPQEFERPTIKEYIYQVYQNNSS